MFLQENLLVLVLFVQVNPLVIKMSVRVKLSVLLLLVKHNCGSNVSLSEHVSIIIFHPK